ncbi:MAG: mce associated protein mas1a [Mycobacterium sp.]|nr:mce associated protein mas1a [Mycobacterium sp.]
MFPTDTEPARTSSDDRSDETPLLSAEEPNDDENPSTPADSDSEPDDDDPEPTEDTGDARATRRASPRRIAGALLLTGFVAVSAALGYTLYQQSELSRLQHEAVDTTRGYLAAMSSFDYQNLDANKAEIAAESTPDFAKRYDEMVTALRDIVIAGKGVATATTIHAATESLDEHSATVIAFVDQSVTNVTAPKGNQQRYRMVVTLAREGDRWLVSNVETL